MMGAITKYSINRPASFSRFHPVFRAFHKGFCFGFHKPASLSVANMSNAAKYRSENPKKFQWQLETVMKQAKGKIPGPELMLQPSPAPVDYSPDRVSI